MPDGVGTFFHASDAATSRARPTLDSYEGNVGLPLKNGKYRKPVRPILGLLGSLALAVWFFHFYLWSKYDGTRPLQPDASSGTVYPLNTHGHVVYLNKAEDARLSNLTILTLSLFGTGVLMDVLLVSGFDRRPKPWEKKQW